MFKSNFNQPGKGIPKDAPKKKGFALFNEILIREFWTLMSLNILFIVACIPIVTAGAAYSAMYHVIIKMMRDEPVDLFVDFKAGFKKNWKQGTQVYVISVLVVAVFYTAYVFYTALHPLLFYVMNAALFYLVMAYIYVVPMLVSVDLPLKNVYKNSVSLSIVSLVRTIAATIIAIALVLATLMFFPVSTFYMLLIGFSLHAFIMAFFTYYAIRKYVEFHEEDGEQAEAELLLEEKVEI